MPTSFEPSGFFVWRTPLLPFDDFVAWNEGLEAGATLDDPVHLEQALAADRTRLRTRLVEIMQRPEVREALFVASPHLDESLEIWMREPESERGKGIELALVRYFTRMAGRATPFGLCAGCSVGTLGPQTQLILQDRAQYRRQTRLDMDYLDPLCSELARDPGLRRALTYWPNSSLYRAAGRVRYVESRLKEKERSYHLVAVEETESLSQTLDRARMGSSLAALSEALVDEEISLTDAEKYVSDLIESQILVPDLAPFVTGSEPTQSLIEELEKQPAAEQAAKILKTVGTQLAQMDVAGLGNAPKQYRAGAELLQSLPAKVELPRLFQVDMVKPVSVATLGKAVVDEIMRGVNVLHRLMDLSSKNSEKRNELTRFREAFMARYEGREVPLVEALDSEIGIGFPPSGGSAGEASPLLHELAFPAEEEEETARWGKLEKFLLRKLSGALQDGAQEIILDPHELEKISAKEPSPLPDAFSVTATVAAVNETALARGDFSVLLDGSTGPSGARFLGRFCHADDGLRQEVERHLRAEESLRPEAIFAEIVHLPEGRLGNILARPVLRAYEIPFLGRAGAAADGQISIADLYVSMRGNQIVLRSARLGREIIPRLTSAHNFGLRPVGLYQFLCLLQGQGVAANLGWSWGALQSARFLPRVTTGRLVLARACWNVDEKELKALGEQTGSARFRTLNAWRRKRRLPQLVALADGDNTLPIDFDNVLSVETFVHLTKGRQAVRLNEMFPAPDQLCARGPEGCFLHELIVPFVQKGAEKKQPEQRADSSVSIKSPSRFEPRTFPPGSEWLYAKLYTGSATADHVLREVIAPLAADVLKSGAADHWFFIRYGDPDWHLRVRLHGQPERLHGEVMPAIQAAATRLLEEGRLARVQFDTYEREVERYGGMEGIALAEQIFHADSEAVLNIVETLEPGDAGLDERWRLAVRGIDALLNDLGFDLETKLALLRKTRTQFAKEFRVDAQLRSQMGERFRKERESLEALLDPAHEPDHALAPGFEIFRQRSARLAPIVAELKKCGQAGQLTVSLGELAPSYIHMHANRLLRSAHRAHEAVLYEFLARLYDSQLARMKDPNSNSGANARAK